MHKGSVIQGFSCMGVQLYGGLTTQTAIGQIRWGSFDYKLEDLVLFVRVKNEWRVNNPSHTSLSFPKTHPI